MLTVVGKYITDNQLFTRNNKLLIAISGGKDSVVLAHILHALGHRFEMAHCNFQLRGQESDGDEAFVRLLADGFGVNCFVERFDTKNFAKQRGISTQMAARELRYEWFERIRTEHGHDFLLTAHHQNDQIETILLNLVRGTGLAGLRGILPKNQTIVRPLLCLSSKDIEKYIADNKLQWREDSSNASDDYQRNLLRHKVVPILESLNPNLGQTIARTSEIVASAERLVAQQLQKPDVEQTIFSRFGIMAQGDVINLQAVDFDWLSFRLSRCGLNYDQLHDLGQCRATTEAKMFLSNDYDIELSRGEAIVMPKRKSNMSHFWVNDFLGEEQKQCFEGEFPKSIQFEIQNNVPTSFHKNTLYLDYHKLSFPLKLRPWQEGDVFCPIGMKGKKKKISDFLTDQKIPSSLKKYVWIVESAGEIAGIVGFRGAEGFRVGNDSARILEINYSKI